MKLDLQGKRAIVTGASRGLGRAIARSLAEEGVRVVIGARHREDLEKTAEEILMETGEQVHPLTVDVTSDQAVSEFVGQAVALLGGLDILVNNAATPGGSKITGKIAEVDTADLLLDVDVKLGGYLRMSRSAVPHMLGNHWGRIINIGGLAARRTGNYLSAVRSGAVSAITKNLADELGDRGITANAIHPGYLRTPKATPATEEAARREVGIGRLVDYHELAWLVTMLASPKAALINGQTLQASSLRGVIDY